MTFYVYFKAENRCFTPVNYINLEHESICVVLSSSVQKPIALTTPWSTSKWLFSCSRIAFALIFFYHSYFICIEVMVWSPYVILYPMWFGSHTKVYLPMWVVPIHHCIDFTVALPSLAWFYIVQVIIIRALFLFMVFTRSALSPFVVTINFLNFALLFTVLHSFGRNAWKNSHSYK